MGSDNLHHLRKAKTARSIARNKAKKASCDRVLIVCEGSKTEPNYFKELIRFYRLSSADVEIDGSCGSSPISVFDRAVLLHKKENDKGNGFDRVYCVFDKDRHSTYEEALMKLSAKKLKGVFFGVTSVPCFEYWLLLHFKFTTKPFTSTPKLSVGDLMLKELIKELPSYKKGAEGIFKALFERLESAKKNAEKSLVLSRDNETDNPSTHIHTLVEYLQNLKSS